MNNNDDSSNLWWWACTIITALGSIFLSNLTFGRGRVIAELEKIIAEQDKIIDEQNEKLRKFIKDDNGIR